ncbi:uncharacterized protein LOC142345329 isoform X2 [Convolutriloba macropyga]|uniref:uncharacterized protein LOC142345329 isoform X2 n=1 Tax=Convolutriloba macropyga TaxID=536237 RepID=UPI003F525F45
MLQLLLDHSLTLCFLAYQFLSCWSLMFDGFLPQAAYGYYYVVSTFIFVWAIHDPTSALSCFCLMSVQVHGFIQDIFAFSFHFQDAQNLAHAHPFEYVLCMMAFFVNFFLRPLYVLMGYYHFMDRRGEVTQALLRRSGGSQLDSRVTGGNQEPQQAPPPNFKRQQPSGADSNPFEEPGAGRSQY